MLFTARIFVLLEKVIRAIFVYILIKPLVFIFNILLYKRLVKWHHLYGSLKRKLSKEQPGIKRRLLTQGFVHSFITALIIVAIFYQFFTANQARAFSSKVTGTILAEVVSSEFGELLGDEELIEETYNEESVVFSSESQISQYSGTLEPNVDVTTQTEVVIKPKLDIEMSKDKAMALQNEAGKIKPETVTLDTPTTSAQPRTITVEYTVQPGDSVSTIAEKFGVSVNTILWENNLSAYSLIRPGNTLDILPVTGITHKVSSGENLSYISNHYDVETNKILAANNLTNVNSLKIDQKLIIPEGRKIYYTSTTASQSSSSGIDVIRKLVSPASTPAANKMLWPTEGHRITQYYSWRHKGLDIANKTGTPLYAADAGTVIYAGWNTGYGYNVLIDHGGGKRTRYAHASKLYVTKGDVVSMGESIAAMGSTGWSTGPHIHFEVIINDTKLNPLNYIR